MMSTMAVMEGSDRQGMIARGYSPRTPERKADRKKKG
jgi:hypothetical protein